MEGTASCLVDERLKNTRCLLDVQQSFVDRAAFNRLSFADHAASTGPLLMCDGGESDGDAENKTKSYMRVGSQLRAFA